MMPIVNGLEDEFKGQFTILRLDANVPANERLQASYGMRGHPTFLVLDEAGGVAAQFFGLQSVEILREAMTAVSPQTNP